MKYEDKLVNKRLGGGNEKKSKVKIDVSRSLSKLDRTRTNTNEWMVYCCAASGESEWMKEWSLLISSSFTHSPFVTENRKINKNALTTRTRTNHHHLAIDFYPTGLLNLVVSMFKCWNSSSSSIIIVIIITGTTINHHYHQIGQHLFCFHLLLVDKDDVVTVCWRIIFKSSPHRSKEKESFSWQPSPARPIFWLSKFLADFFSFLANGLKLYYHQPKKSKKDK